MIRAWCRAFALVALAVVVFTAMPVRAALVADPAVLYAQMKAAYDKGGANGWGFLDQERYFSTIVNAGRAYALQYPDDPAYGELATLTVTVGTGINYNPLINHDGAVWYVRQAANWVEQHSSDTDTLAHAKAILARVDAEGDPEQLARYADEDAKANLTVYPRDAYARLALAEANWRGWLLTHDASWRSLALAHAADTMFPIANLPTTYGNELITAANSAAAGVDGYTPGDRVNGKIIVERLKHVDPLRVIGSVKSVPHDVYLSTLAPADEYFGRMGMSILGIENQLKHLNFMLDYHYGNRESGETALVAEAIDDMHKVYPRDRDLPMLLLWCYQTLARMDDATARTASAHIRSILTVEYQDSPEARKLLNPPATP